MDNNDGLSQWAALRVVAVYELPVPIWTSTDVLGRRFHTGLGGVTFDVVMPGAMGATGLAAAPTISGMPVTMSNPIGEQAVWAQRYAAFTPGRDSESTALCRVAIVTQDDEHELARVIDAWFDDVRTWVETVSGQDLDPHHRVYDATSHGATLSLVKPPRTSDGPLALTITTPRISPLPSAHWEPMLRAVAQGIGPPLEELLSRNARAAFSRAQYRRAVIDAASAVEIALHRRVNAQMALTEAAEKWARQALAKSDKQTLGTVVRLGRYGSVVVGVHYDDLDELVAARNDALHRGTSLGHSETFKVLRTCNEVLGAVGLWPRQKDDRDDGSEWVVYDDTPDSP